MDRYEGAAQLEWWANPLTCLFSTGIRIVVASDDSGWHASATFAPPLAADEFESWTLFTESDPYFTLRFNDDKDATIDVRVKNLSEQGLSLTPCEIT